MTRTTGILCSMILAALGAACGGGGAGGSTTGVPVTDPTPAAGPACEQFDSTFAAIQKVVFENKGCTQDVCHGSARSGGLDLRQGAAYANLLEVASLSSPNPRIQPGEPSESFLFQKLSAATLPGSFTISGSPMPSGLAPLSENELQAIRMWIEAGAPETGSVGDADTGTSDGIAELLDACLPPAEPITIEPLKPPAADEGVQFVMPTFVLPASTELEVCFASYYDISDVVPPADQDPARGVFYMNGSRIRQDPQSHHFIFKHSGLDASFVHHPAFGTWTCHGGERAGTVCEATDLASCGDGICTSEVRNTVACTGYGPRDGVLDLTSAGLAGAQTAQQYVPPRDGVYREVPLRGILYWNSHAFNLTSENHDLNGRINVFFARDRRSQWIDGTDSSHVYIAHGQPPYTIQSYCADHVVPQGVQIISISSHTHKRGKRFWVEAPDGAQIYESFVYSDPIEQQYDPPLTFDSPDAAERTLRYCATYNNGVKADGAPDPSTVTRLSRMPDRASCTPVACTAGKVGAACGGADDGASCDSSPGAGDGECDACPITAGVTTENEMFVIVPAYVKPAP